MQKTILIVDDEADIRNLVKEILEDEGYATLTAANSKEVEDILRSHKPDLAVLDIWLQDSKHDGLQILEIIKAGQHAHIPVIMISGHGTIETAVSAIKKGAYDFIEKPFKSDRLVLMVRRGLEASSLELENAALREQSLSDVSIVGDSQIVSQLRTKIQNIAATNSRTLIQGPLGSGKTTLAKCIHGQSERAHEMFLVHSCTHDDVTVDALSERLASAHNGTLVLQSVCSLCTEEQRALLSLLQKPAYNARIIATVLNVDKLEKDLYDRLAVEIIEAPALSDRKQDIESLAVFFLDQAAFELGLNAPQISKDVLDYLEKYEWPGNLSEMRAAMLYALINNDGASQLSVGSLPGNISGEVAQPENVEILQQAHYGLSREILDLPLRDARELFERDYLTSQVDRFDGNISKTAQYIGMERSALHRKIKSLQDKNVSNESDSKKAVSSKA
jgi:two-component system nitrogen regulation response regulator NtrX